MGLSLICNAKCFVSKIRNINDLCKVRAYLVFTKLQSLFFLGQSLSKEILSNLYVKILFLHLIQFH